MFFQMLLLSAALETGFISGGAFNYNDRTLPAWRELGALYTELDAKVSYGPAYIDGGFLCYLTPVSVINYSPFQMTYTIGAGLDFGKVKLGYEHACFHPMNPYGTFFGNELRPVFEGATNKIFLRIER